MTDDTDDNVLKNLSDILDRPRHWILKDQVPVPVDLMTWARWFEEADRIVKQTPILDDTLTTIYEVSTVFLGLDHNYSPTGPPLIFETMVFAPQTGYQDLDCRRYSTWHEAEAGHAEIVQEYQAKGRQTKEEPQ